MEGEGEEAKKITQRTVYGFCPRSLKFICKCAIIKSANKSHYTFPLYSRPYIIVRKGTPLVAQKHIQVNFENNRNQ